MSKVVILKPLRVEHITKSISLDSVTPRLSKNMLIVKITCFIVEIFALKVDVLREISTKKQEIWDFDRSQSKFELISNKRYKLLQWILSKPCFQKNETNYYRKRIASTFQRCFHNIFWRRTRSDFDFLSCTIKFQQQ